MQLIGRLFYSLLITSFCILFMVFITKQRNESRQTRQEYTRFLNIEDRIVSKAIQTPLHVKYNTMHTTPSLVPWHTQKKHNEKRIPRHIHQYWNGKSPPSHLMQQCRDLHPTWNYTLWTPDSIQTSKPFHNRAIYDCFSTQQVNGQSDVVRYSVLREFGGVYLDADTACLRPLDDLLQYGFFAGYHSKDNAGTRENDQHHPNRELVASAVMGSLPQHPLTVRLTDDLNNTYQNGMAWSTVGPGHLTRTLRNCPECNISGDIIILPFHAFVPYHHEENEILKAHADNLWKLPKLRAFKSYAMNLWGTTFNKWHKLSMTKLRPIGNHTIQDIDFPQTVSSIKFPIAQPYKNSLNLSIIIPAILVDTEINLPALLFSISTQTVQNREIIIVLTGIANEKCSDFKQQTIAPIPCRIFCFETQRHEAWARNYGVRQASSEWVAFFDSDDLLFPNHNAVLKHWIYCNPMLRLILHGFTGKTHVDTKSFEVISGTRLWNAAKKLEHQRGANPLFTSIMHSQAVSRRDDALAILFREIPGEDSMWCRDMVLRIGEHNDQMIADTSPLSWYIPRAGHKKPGFSRPGILKSDLIVQKYCDGSTSDSRDTSAKYLVFATCFGSMCRKYENNLNTMRCYAAQHEDYAFVTIDLDQISDPALQRGCSKKSPMFLRHCVFANYLANHPHYRGALFIEADCAVFNYEIRFENFLRAETDMSMDIRFHNGEITAGIYIVRNVAFVLDFLKQWSVSNFPHNADNGALHRLILDTTGHTTLCQSIKSYEAFMRCFHETIEKSQCSHSLFSKIAFRHPMDAIQYDGWLLRYRYSNATFVQHAMKNPPITIKGSDGYVVTDRLSNHCWIPRLATHYISADEEHRRLEAKNLLKVAYRRDTMGFRENSCLAPRLVLYPLRLTQGHNKDSHTKKLSKRVEFNKLIHCSISESYAKKPKLPRGVRWHSQEGEDKYMYQNFFHGKRGPSFVVVEIGAFDGVHLSNSYVFEKYFGWKSVLIEASPENFKKLNISRSSANPIFAGVCESERTVAITRGGGEMAKLNNGSGDIPCFPMEKLLSRAGVGKIDFFSLDVEGAEAIALSTHNFTKNPVDVFLVEMRLNRGVREDSKNDQARSILQQNGFCLLAENIGHQNEVWVNASLDGIVIDT